MNFDWKAFLSLHPDVDYLNNNIRLLQDTFCSDTPSKSRFDRLLTNNSLIVLTRSIIPDELQATYFHSARRDSFQQETPFFNAFTRFGPRACAVRIDPDSFFHKVRTRQNIPTLAQSLACTTADDVCAIIPNPEAEKSTLYSFAVIPPLLAATIYDMDILSTKDVIDAFISKIKTLHPQQNPPSQEDTIQTEEIRQVTGSLTKLHQIF